MGARFVKVQKGQREKSSFFGLRKKVEPTFKGFWQKAANTSFFSPKFYPHDYQGINYSEKKKHAYEDAKTNRRFYQDLIDKGVFPEGTSVKVRRIRHQDGYGLEFFVPHLRKIPTVTSWRQVFTNTDSAKDKEIQRELEEGKKRCRDTIQETAKKYGYQHGLGEDVYPNRNYGLDQNGEVRIHDVHLLSWNLPDRFKLPEEERHGQFYNSPRRKSLEKAIAQAGVIISLSSGLVLLSPNLTGNTIANLNQTSSNWIGGILFILGLTSALLYFNKK